MLIVFAVDSTRKHLKVSGLPLLDFKTTFSYALLPFLLNAHYFQILGVTKLGHQKRILNSLKKAKEERRQRAAERAAAAQEEEADSGQESR